MNAVLIFIKRCDIWWNTLIKFSKETGNNFAKIIKNKNSLKPSQTTEMELFLHVVTGFSGELRILATPKMEVFANNSENRKAVCYFCKNLQLGCLTIPEYALASNVKDISCLNQFKYQR